MDRHRGGKCFGRLRSRVSSGEASFGAAGHASLTSSKLQLSSSGSSDSVGLSRPGQSLYIHSASTRTNLALSHQVTARNSTMAEASGSKGYNPKLELVSWKTSYTGAKIQIPFEKLQAMIIKNQDEKLSLLDQKETLEEEGDDWMGEDPEMITQKM